MVKLLVANGANLQLRDKVSVILIVAVYMHNFLILSILHDFLSSPPLQYGRTPLDLAKQRDHQHIVTNDGEQIIIILAHTYYVAGLCRSL